MMGCSRMMNIRRVSSSINADCVWHNDRFVSGDMCDEWRQHLHPLKDPRDLKAAHLREFYFLRQLSACFQIVHIEANIPKRIYLGDEHTYPGKKDVNTRPSGHKCAFFSSREH